MARPIPVVPPKTIAFTLRHPTFGPTAYIEPDETDHRSLEARQIETSAALTTKSLARPGRVNVARRSRLSSNTRFRPARTSRGARRDMFPTPRGDENDAPRTGTAAVRRKNRRRNPTGMLGAKHSYHSAEARRARRSSLRPYQMHERVTMARRSTFSGESAARPQVLRPRRTPTRVRATQRAPRPAPRCTDCPRTLD